MATWLDLESIMLSEIGQTGKRQILNHFTYMWNLEKETPELIDKTRLVVARDGGWAKWVKVQTSSYKINKSWCYDVQHNNYS